MAHMKGQNVDWLDEAWRISAVIAELPDGPPGLLSVERKWPPLTGLTKQWIEILQTTISLHLAYRIRVVHKHRLKFPDGSVRMFIWEGREPVETLKTYAALESIGVKLTSVDKWAIDGHAKLGRILIDRYVCKAWKRELPLIVASIGGASTSQVATLKAKQPRNIDRRSTLAKAVAQERGHDQFATAGEVLDRLCGGDVVKECKDGRVWYWNHKGDLKSVGLDRFETIFSEQKPSTG